MAEERTIPGFEYYVINRNGDVFTVPRMCDRTDGKPYRQRRQLVKPRFNKLVGRFQLCLRREDGVRQTVYRHRLMATTFIPNPENLPEINHINGIKTDDSIENLEWCTRIENAQHAERLGLKNHRSGEKNSRFDHGLASKNNWAAYARGHQRAMARGLKWAELSTHEKNALVNEPLRGIKHG